LLRECGQSRSRPFFESLLLLRRQGQHRTHFAARKLITQGADTVCGLLRRYPVSSG
jgi:hypothetical protein